MLREGMEVARSNRLRMHESRLGNIVADLFEKFGPKDEGMRRDPLKIEPRQQLAQRDRLGLGQPAARPGEQADQSFGLHSRLPQGRQAGITMALGEPSSIGTHHERDMTKARGGPLQRLVQEQLSGCGGQQIVATNDFGHATVRVVNNDGQLVGRCSSRFPDHEVTAHPFQIDRNGAAKGIHKVGRMIDTKAPSKRLVQRIGIRGSARSTGSGVDRAFVFPMGGTGRGGNVRPGAGAGINLLLRFQAGERLLVAGEPGGLYPRFAVPIQAEPTQVDESLFHGTGFDAWRVDVLETKEQSATLLACRQPGNQVGPCIANMLRPRRRRSQPSDVSRRGHGGTHG